MKVRGKYGSISLSTHDVNAPLIFVVGGVTMPKKGTVPPNFYPGDKLENRDGYMWNWQGKGFDRYTQFNTYVCYLHNQSANAWKECYNLLIKYKIYPKEFILVTFSAGVTRAYESTGVLSITSPKQWNKYLFAGAYIQSDINTKINNLKYTIDAIGNKNCYYFSVPPMTKSTEGSSPIVKQKIASLLPEKNTILIASNHGNQVELLSDFCAKNIPVKKTGNILNPEQVYFDKATKKVVPKEEKKSTVTNRVMVKKYRQEFRDNQTSNKGYAVGSVLLGSVLVYLLSKK
jgi:hypothetical protein